MLYLTKINKRYKWKNKIQKLNRKRKKGRGQGL